VQWPVFNSPGLAGDSRLAPVLSRLNQSAATFGMSIPS
jgi:hypothetical protein